MKKHTVHIPTVTIGIPAYNEEGNITQVLQSLLQQSSSFYFLDAIYCVSDCSTDKTDEIVRNFPSRKVVFLRNNKRIGKSLILNKLCARSNSDILVVLDADISIKSPHMIDRLVKPFENPKVMLTSGHAKPHEVNSFFQKILYVGYELHERSIRRVKKSDMYKCEGAVRAFRKKFYKQLTFPQISSEDVYPYLICQQEKYTFVPVMEAVVYKKLPSTYTDYLKQIRRYLMSRSVHTKRFSAKVIQDSYTIGTKEKIVTFIVHFFKDPVYTTLYISILLYPKIINIFSKVESGVWEISTSTKSTRQKTRNKIRKMLYYRA